MTETLTIYDNISKVTDKKTKIELSLLFIEEIGGMLTHIKNVGLSWGAGGEECRASKSYNRYREEIEKIKKLIIREAMSE